MPFNKAVILSKPIPVSIEGFGRLTLSDELICSNCMKTKFQISINLSPSSFGLPGGPLLYFGGYSDDGIELCAEFCDVYLMWPDKEENLNELIKKVNKKAMKYGRSIKFGLRIHVIVRETEDEARAYARGLISRLNLKKGEDIKNQGDKIKWQNICFLIIRSMHPLTKLS